MIQEKDSLNDTLSKDLRVKEAEASSSLAQLSALQQQVADLERSRAEALKEIELLQKQIERDETLRLTLQDLKLSLPSQLSPDDFLRDGPAQAEGGGTQMLSEALQTLQEKVNYMCDRLPVDSAFMPTLEPAIMHNQSNDSAIIGSTELRVQNAALQREVESLSERIREMQDVESLAKDIRLRVDSFQHLVQDLLTEKEKCRQLELQCRSLQSEVCSEKVQWYQGQKQRLLEDELHSWKDLAGDFESMRWLSPQPISPPARTNNNNNIIINSSSSSSKNTYSSRHDLSTRNSISPSSRSPRSNSKPDTKQLKTEQEDHSSRQDKKSDDKRSDAGRAAEKIPTAADLLRSRKSGGGKQVK